MILKKQTEPAKIGDLEINVVRSRTLSYENEVTEYPVEDGFRVSDHVSKRPVRLSVDCVFSPTPVSFYSKLGGAKESRLREVAQALKKIYEEGKPVTVKMPDAIYENMVMTSAPLPRNVIDGICYSMELLFTQVKIVKPKTGEISETDSEVAEMAGETEADAGEAEMSALEADEPKAETAGNASGLRALRGD